MGRKDGRVVKGTEGKSGTRCVTLRKDCYCRLSHALLSLKRKEGGEGGKWRKGWGIRRRSRRRRKMRRRNTDGERVKIQVQKSVSLARSNTWS